MSDVCNVYLSIKCELEITSADHSIVQQLNYIYCFSKFVLWWVQTFKRSWAIVATFHQVNNLLIWTLYHKKDSWIGYLLLFWSRFEIYTQELYTHIVQKKKNYHHSTCSSWLRALKISYCLIRIRLSVTSLCNPAFVNNTTFICLPFGFGSEKMTKNCGRIFKSSYKMFYYSVK